MAFLSITFNVFRGKCCPFFWPVLGGKTVFSFLEVLFCSFLFISANWVGRILGWVRLNYCSDFLEGSSGKTLRFGVGFLTTPRFFLGYVRVLVIFRLLLAVPLKFGLFVTPLLTNQG